MADFERSSPLFLLKSSVASLRSVGRKCFAAFETANRFDLPETMPYSGGVTISLTESVIVGFVMVAFLGGRNLSTD